MDKFLGKLKKKTGSGRNKAGKNKEHGSPEESRSPSPSLSPEPQTPVSAASSFWNLNEDWPREALETTLRPPAAPSADRHSNYRPHRRAPETPPTTPSQFPPGFSSHPYENTKKSYPPPWTSGATAYPPLRIVRKELPKREPPNDDKLPSTEKIHQAAAVSEITVRAVPQAESESEPDLSTRNTPKETEDRVVHSVEIPSLDSKTSTTSFSNAERTAQLLAKKYARLVHQQDELRAEKYMRIIGHREELESRGILWPTSPSTHEFPDDDADEPQGYEFPQFVPKPLLLRKEPKSEGLRSNQRQISNGVVHDYEAAKLESWKQFYGKEEMMRTLHNEIDGYLGALMFERLLKETDTRQSADYRSEVTVRNYWDDVRGYLGLGLREENAMS
ncbi:hypothetical protein VE03_10086 [Pseudogymnoascus sp. 23342-1-I1]|nr:hypothetical protein VE03_10086 [Pseudogymnoascus sp. 23342-1-I1]